MAMLQGGKLAFGRQCVRLTAQTRVDFNETAVHLPGKEVDQGRDWAAPFKVGWD